MKKNAAPKPTTAELNMLRLLWKLGPSTAKEAHQAALKDRPELTSATVLRLLQVMHAKGLLLRDESQRSHVYSAAQAQKSLQTNLLKDLIHKAFSGSAKDLVMAALQGHVSKEERAEIQRLLNEEKT
ncbi:BlaI/MecI/CopY family transcriptional regulator [Undibacterium sp. Dicai25W]|uniref:BlaI/MecI/CopY family transcriptional regulator n=1 Tax=Undibacterium sp. Dicai25W TaxID=3413034 RepID=UPI003BEFE91E